MLVNKHDQFVGKSLLALGEFSPGERRFFESVIERGWRVFDCGANIGAHTLTFAKCVGEEGAVFAFEPQRFVFHLLCANLALNHVTNTHAIMAGLGRMAGVIAVPILDPDTPANFGGLELGDRRRDHDNVPLLVLDQFAELDHIDFLKIDVEGMEIPVLDGAQELLAKHRPLLYVENDRKLKAQTLIDTLERSGYKLWWHQTPLFETGNFRGEAVSPWEKNYVSTNMMCVPTERVSSFAPVVDLQEVA